MQLYLKENKKEILISNPITDDDCWNDMINYLQENNIIWFYMRSWIRDNQTYYDFGNHTKFFIVKKINKNRIYY